MKITIQPEQLASAIRKVAPIVPARATLPVLTNILITARNGGAVELWGSNLDTTVMAKAAAEVDDVSQGVAIPKRFLTHVARTANGPVSIEPKGRTRGIDGAIIRYDGLRFEVQGFDVEDYPARPKPLPVSADIPADLVVRGAERAVWAASSEESRPILNGVLLRMLKASITAVATNGHRLAIQEGIAGEVDKPIDLIARPDALFAAKRLFGGSKSISTAWGDPRSQHDAFNPGGISSPMRLEMWDGDGMVSSRLIEGPYPNYEAVIPRDPKTTVTLRRVELAGLIHRALGLWGGQGSRYATYRGVLSFSAEGGALRSSLPDAGEVLAELPVEGSEGPPMDIGFNLMYLKDVLRVTPGELVTLEMAAPERAMVVRGHPDPDGLTVIVMPLRILD